MDCKDFTYRPDSCDSFQKLIEDSSRLLWSVSAGILQKTGCREDIEDILSEVYLELWEHPDHYDPARGTLKTWLCLRTRSKSLDLLRRRSREELTAMQQAEEHLCQENGIASVSALSATPDPVFQMAVNRITVQNLIEEMAKKPHPLCDLLLMRFLYEMKPAEIALALKLDIQEVYTLLKKSRKEFQKRWEDWT